MSKLRLIRERRTESGHYDQDLRGLMNNALPAGPMAYPVLSVVDKAHLISSSEKLRSLVSDEYSCRLQPDDSNPNIVHFVYQEQALVAAKIQAIRLFYLGIVLQKTVSGARLSLRLWQANSFAERIARAYKLEAYDNGLNPSRFFKANELVEDSQFIVRHPVTTYLQQSGLEGFAHARESKIVDVASVMQALRSPSVPSETSMPKVAGE